MIYVQKCPSYSKSKKKNSDGRSLQLNKKKYLVKSYKLLDTAQLVDRAREAENEAMD